MGFFTNNKGADKKELNLPELPGSPRLPELPSLPQQNIPSFPNKAEYSPSSQIQTIPTNQQGLQVMKNSAIDNNFIAPPPMNNERRTIEISDSPTLRMIPRTISKEPLFIKIDRFQEAVKKFEEVKSKVTDIENALMKIKDMREKEDQELRSWEEEIKIMKEKVSNIDNSLFNKI